AFSADSETPLCRHSQYALPPSRSERHLPGSSGRRRTSSCCQPASIPPPHNTHHIPPHPLQVFCHPHCLLEKPPRHTPYSPALPSQRSSQVSTRKKASPYHKKSPANIPL